MTRRSRRAKPRGLIGLSLLLVSGVLVSQSPNASPPTKAIYANRALAFRYTPPGGMRDKTSRFQLQIQDPLLASGMPQTLGMLLAMSSGPDSDVPFWRSVTIVTYPRSAVSEPDDAKAEAQMSAWVAHSKDASALPRSVVISEQSFSVSIFGLQEGTVKKGAVVWTTAARESSCRSPSPQTLQNSWID